MPDLTPGAVAHLWPVAQLIGLAAMVVACAITGFVWLRGEMEKVAKIIANELVIPVTVRLDAIENELEHIRSLVEEHERHIAKYTDREDD